MNKKLPPKWPMDHQTLPNWIGRLRRKWRRIPLKIWAYRIGMLLGVAWLPLELHGSDSGWRWFSAMTLALSGLALTVGLALDLRVWAGSMERWVGRSWMGHVMAAGVVAMSGAFSAAYASTLINNFSGVAGQPFPYTLTGLAVPAALALSVLILAIIYIALALIVLGQTMRDMPANVLMLSSTRNRARRNRRSFYALVRLLAIGMLLTGLLTVSPWFERGLISLAKQFAVRFEMYPNDPCAAQGERVSRLSDEVVLVAWVEEGEVLFERRRCGLAVGLP